LTCLYLTISSLSLSLPPFCTQATLVCGYAFAWVGHFVYQKNRPATFIYPTYSLMGDFKMWSQEAPKLIQEVIGGAGSTASRTAPQTKSKN
jgi:hypothetical protein